MEKDNTMYENAWTRVGDFYYREIGKIGKREKYSDYLCICGKVKSVRCQDVNSDRSKSCGCLKVKKQTKHGAWRDELYSTWSGIKTRCYNINDIRYKNYGYKGVTMYKPWLEDFQLFKKWCLDNGWKKGMFLCRTGDTGNYEPNNLRVDTPQSNVEEAIAKTWFIVKPSGEKIKIFNLCKFCRENKLDTANMHRVLTGKQDNYKGWKSWDVRVYITGGFVRDRLLGIESKDSDFVVVGASDEYMVSRGFTKVGASFGVYIHPITGGEYALARTERNMGKGYNNFSCSYKNVSLEEDLSRRDLRINSMTIEVDREAALSEGKVETLDDVIIDPCDGIQDIKNKTLRATSSAFQDDPVRTLRVARFLARFGKEWRIDVDTWLMMDHMWYEGEYEHLVPERVWLETEKALKTKTPSLFFDTLRLYGIFPELNNLYKIPQPFEHHPESCSYYHSLMVLDHAANTWNDTEISWAAVTHDLGKSVAYNIHDNLHGHEDLGVPVVKDLCKRLKVPNNYRDLALITTEHHTRVHSCMGRNGQNWTRPKSIMKLLEQTNALAKPQRFEKFLKACESDAKGRGLDYHEKYEYTIDYFLNKEYPQREYLLECLNAAKSVDTKSISSKMVEEGKDGKLIGEQIRVARIDSIRKVQRLWKLKIENKLNSED